MVPSDGENKMEDRFHLSFCKPTVPCKSDGQVADAFN